ncbi:HdeD family acid-resistance protein [Streptoalloteichus hindustanus]|uniref:Uncharacterized membrane protein HdeD, DUF308 family n=1 Tax=Streptoalloteichus hindustanus TaxID=2017 RepID=A0A1M5HFH1_STRHI|nr:DUF308 domain-containing protein [Streptoalloteichus hindustanus]SHG14695.1 Uncharacterized membrane protein HdeD, DUF308 family [Streptoalloteichus hindustanus]
MGELMLRRWWMPAARGVAAILFGLVTLVWPAVTLLALVLLWGVFALVDGVMALSVAFSGATARTAPTGDRWTWGLLGLLGVLAGVVALLWPGITAIALALVIAVWAVVVGVLQIVAAVRLRRVIRNEWLLGIAGALTALLGVLLFVRPGTGALALVTVIAVFAILWGVVLVLLGLRLRRLTTGATGGAI